MPRFFRDSTELRAYLAGELKQERSLHEIARSDFAGQVPPGTLSRIVRDLGYEPKREKTRKRLRLAVLLPAPACPKCGQVHVTSRCPHTEKKARVTWRSRLTDALLDRLQYLDR